MGDKNKPIGLVFAIRPNINIVISQDTGYNLYMTIKNKVMEVIMCLIFHF